MIPAGRCAIEQATVRSRAACRGHHCRSLASRYRPRPDAVPAAAAALRVARVRGALNREQARAIEFLREENRVLREQLGRRIRLDDGQRRRLAAKGAALGRKSLQSLATIVTPDTILRWHRELVAAKFTHAAKRPLVGRPGLMKTIREQIVRMAKKNTRWGYARNDATSIRSRAADEHSVRGQTRSPEFPDSTPVHDDAPQLFGSEASLVSPCGTFW